MPRYVFYSFDYEMDNARVQQVKNMGRVESQPLLNGNKWEEVRGGGDAAIQRWIDINMGGKTCLVVLVGQRTADRRWVQYEIKKAWELGLGVAGVRINGLKNLAGQTSPSGRNPFSDLQLKGTPFSNIVTLHEPWGFESTQVYANISSNIEQLVENAIAIRKRY